MVVKIPTTVAARALQKSENFVRAGLQTGRLDIGYAVQTKGRRWTYLVVPERLSKITGIPIEELGRMCDEYHEKRRLESCGNG